MLLSMSLKIHLISDTHVNLNKTWIFPNCSADVLIIPGDVSSNFKEVCKYLNFCSSLFKQVIYIFGNHEFVARDILDEYKMAEQLRTMINKNVEVLVNQEFEHEGVLFYGGYCSPILSKEVFNIKDKDPLFHRTFGITYDTMVEAHQNYVECLGSAVRNGAIIISHPAPTKKALVNLGIFSEYYAVDFENYIAQAKLWIYGHTHENKDFKYLGCRIVSNSVGYLRNGYIYDKDKIIKI